MTDVMESSNEDVAEGQGAGATDRVITLTRRRIDSLLIGLGLVVAIVLAVAGALLTWGSTFASDYVSDELAAQGISFPPAESLEEEGRDDLVQYGGQQVVNGEMAEAYASFIAGHVEHIAEGATYAELGTPERAAAAAVDEAIANDAPEDEIAALQEEANAISGQRESIFRGEMLRSALLSTYAWSTIGSIAGIAAIAAFIASVVMLGLVIAGLVHVRRT